MFMPFNILGIWIRAIFSLLLLGVGIFLIAKWYENRKIVVMDQIEVSQRVPEVDEKGALQFEPQTGELERVYTKQWRFGVNRETAFLLGGTALICWSIFGGWVWSPRMLRRVGTNEPTTARKVHENDSQVRMLQLPDGSRVRVEYFGPLDGDPVVLTHGWGLDANEWYYTRKFLSEQNKRVITWDLPGLGASDRPANRDWSIENLARALDVVVATAGDKPVVLLGHSIGVMITLTHSKLFPDTLGKRIRGLVLAQSTYTNPVNTTSLSGLYKILQNPVLVPLCHLMIWTSPIFRALNVMSYLNGSASRSTERGSFSGNETRGQLEFIARYYCKSAPDVIARGMLGMLKYDATEVLSRISVPTLIVAGDNDRVCLPEASRYMAQKIPSAKLFVLNQSRHCGLFEHHEIFHSALNEFLESLPRLKPQGLGQKFDKPNSLVLPR